MNDRPQHWDDDTVGLLERTYNHRDVFRAGTRKIRGDMRQDGTCKQCCVPMTLHFASISSMSPSPSLLYIPPPAVPLLPLRIAANLHELLHNIPTLGWRKSLDTFQTTCQRNADAIRGRLRLHPFSMSGSISLGAEWVGAMRALEQGLPPFVSAALALPCTLLSISACL